MSDLSHTPPLSTEFPVKAKKGRTDFVAAVVVWLQGTKYSTVLTPDFVQELDGENAHLIAPSGEELRLRELRDEDGWSAIGFRHDFPDDEGRLWRTECVLKRRAPSNGEHLVRLRTQCLVKSSGARLETPNKPYLIKALLMNGWGGTDATLAVSDQPVWLNDADEGLTTARAVTVGRAARWLPTIYISATGKRTWLLSQRRIKKLAYDLGGIAHVVVEPDRVFSFKLRDATKGRNAYGGTVALSLPGQGIVRRFFLGWQIQDQRKLMAAVKMAATNLHGQMPASGWDWTELQEQAMRKQREAYKGALSADESEALFDDAMKQIDDLKAENRQLREQLRAHMESAKVGAHEGEFLNESLARVLGPEVYNGEISDRIRFAAKTTLSTASQSGLEERSKAILRRVVDRLPVSPALAELSHELARATKDPKGVSGRLVSILGRHGYSQKSDNKHVRLHAKKNYDGLEPITLPKTPSDSRGLTNLRKQIERTLGITRLGG